MEITPRIKTQLGSWWPFFVPFVESPEWDKIFTSLKMQAQARRVIIPKSADLFRSFEYCDKDKLKAVFFLMDPYPSFKDNVMIADGVPMSCKNTEFLQPSLQLWYDAIEEIYSGFDPDIDKRPDNVYFLKEEGILLINSSLSCEKDKPGSHAQLWAPFMRFFIEEVLNKYFRGLPIVLCGAQAQKLEKYISPLLHYVKKVEHPVAASYSNRTWKHDEVFKWVDHIVADNGGLHAQIRWYRRKGEVGETPLPSWVGTKVKVDKNKNLPKAQDMGLPWSDPVDE